MNKPDARKQLKQLIELSAESVDDEEPMFDSPVQARVFGLVVALSRVVVFEWEAFQQQLIDRIAIDDGSLASEAEQAYYDHWITALVELLCENDMISAAELEKRVEEFAAGDRDASESVVGDRSH